ncbi:PilZ domain-containing protein [Alkalispirochaeta americana]|uniref:PilZ domain-containing protein n=1 Tax=Alkalispirochaeta americana TaxID=159291 RepID=A0A1N6WQK5_9SPIO|nr:PilZ domain-containing protein [Alkalispirochaeta americana]SIQ92360.1 PilZ domain-containing protein [Alkalispirochaeta americana]
MELLIPAMVLVLVVALAYLVFRRDGLGGSWLRFYVRGKETGFSLAEVHLLRRAARERGLSNPEMLFWSVRALEACLQRVLEQYHLAVPAREEERRRFLNKLFDFRAQLEFRKPKYRLGISSTRRLEPGQPLKITVPGKGVFLARVAETARRYVAVSLPGEGVRLPPGFSWKTQKLGVYFWRKDDAGYYFETTVLNVPRNQKVLMLHLAHEDHLERSQKRASVRRETNLAGRVYPLRDPAQGNELEEASGGYRCRVLDISEDGAALALRGRVAAGFSLKLQIEVNGAVLILCGVIRSANYHSEKHISILHLQAQPPSGDMRIKILSYVYRLTEDRSGEDQLEEPYPQEPPPKEDSPRKEAWEHGPPGEE